MLETRGLGQRMIELRGSWRSFSIKPAVIQCDLEIYRMTWTISADLRDVVIFHTQHKKRCGTEWNVSN